MGDRARATGYFETGEREARVNPTQAFNNFTSATYVDPTWGKAHYQLGNNLSDLGYYAAACAAYRRALTCDHTDEDRAKVLTNYGYMLQTLGEIDEALDVSMQAIGLDPKLPMAWCNASLQHQLRNELETSVSCALKAVELDPDNHTYQVQLAFAYMHNRQFAEGLKWFEARFPYQLTNYLSMPFTKWRGESDKMVYVAADQGLGDTLSFARFVPEAAKRCKHLFLGVQAELLSLFEWAFAKIPNLTIQPLNQNFPGYDHWTTFVSLPWALGLTDHQIINCPHIDPRIKSGRRDWRVSDRKLHIGIAWSGSELNLINNHRSIPLLQFLDLYQCPGVQLYSLQKDAKQKDLIDTGAVTVIRDLSGYIGSVADTVSLMKSLDLVITCESACAHIAALADVECIVPYSRLGKDFRIGVDGTKAIWTPKTRYLLQETAGDWKPVFARIVGELKQRVTTKAGA